MFGSGSGSGSMVSDSSVQGTGETVLSVYLSPGSVAFTLRGQRSGSGADGHPMIAPSSP